MTVKTESMPLAGVRVLDVSHIIAGPFCASIIGDLGAEVIKVEPPAPGEPGRRLGIQMRQGNQTASASYTVLSRNRKGLSLDLRSPAGKRLFLSLVQISDVLIENFTPGAMDRLGLSYRYLSQLNPSLVYAAISGYGQLDPYIGPLMSWPANNATAQAMGGLMELTGEANGPPTMVGATVGDTIPGLWAALAILAALQQRQHTGKGQQLDIAMYDCMAAMCYQSLASYHVSGVSPTRSSEGWGITFTGRLECEDGYIAVSMWGNVSERWSNLWRYLGRHDLLGDPEENPVRPGGPGSIATITEVLNEWLAGLPKSQAVDILLGFGFSAGVVQTAQDVYHCQQLSARQIFIDVEDELGGVVRTAGLPIKSSGFQAKSKGKSPKLGEHNREVLNSLLGYTDSDLVELRQQGAFGPRSDQL